MQRALLLVALVTTTACINLHDEVARTLNPTPSLAPNAALPVPRDTDMSKCQPLGMVYATGGTRRYDGKFVPDQNPAERIDAYLRNKATSLGATHILQPNYSLLTTAPDATIYSNAYRCPSTTSAQATPVGESPATE